MVLSVAEGRRESMNCRKSAGIGALSLRRGLFEWIEKSGIHLQIATSVADFDFRFRHAVKIAAPGDEKVEAPGQFKITGRVRFAMGAVMNLHTVEPRHFQYGHTGAKSLARFLDPGGMS